jgi:hypothetical protein
MTTRLLLIDMDEAHSGVIREHFASWFIQEVARSDLTRSARQNYDLVITKACDEKDQTLALCSWIRSLLDCSDLPLLVVLDRWQATQVQYILGLDGARCLIRSFDEGRLASVVAELLPSRSHA